ncbi:hypothetical protein DBR06_SOUSAS2010035, partial [Sousa chinensis]
GGLGRSCLVATCLLLDPSNAASAWQAIRSLRGIKRPWSSQIINQYNYPHEFRDKLTAHLSSRDSLPNSVAR